MPLQRQLGGARANSQCAEAHRVGIVRGQRVDNGLRQSEGIHVGHQSLLYRRTDLQTQRPPGYDNHTAELVGAHYLCKESLANRARGAENDGSFAGHICLNGLTP